MGIISLIIWDHVSIVKHKNRAWSALGLVGVLNVRQDTGWLRVKH